MTDDPRAAEILAILSRECALPVAELRPEARVTDLGIASIDLVQAIFAIETRWNVEIPVAGTTGDSEFATLSDLLSHVLHTLDAAGIPPTPDSPPTPPP